MGEGAGRTVEIKTPNVRRVKNFAHTVQEYFKGFVQPFEMGGETRLIRMEAQQDL